MSPVDAKWDESQPIYRQLRDRVVAMMLEGVLKEGEALPSVRQVATEYRLNPLTVLKAYQQLADEGLVEKRRGLGMFVAARCGRRADEGRAAAFPGAGVATHSRHDPAPGTVRDRTVEQGTAGAGRRRRCRPRTEQKNDLFDHRGARSVPSATAAASWPSPALTSRSAPGRIVGLIGRNGAGKTTVIKSILGLTPYRGSARRCWAQSRPRERDQLMREVSFIADVAVLPKWLQVREALDYVQAVHPAFDRGRAEGFLATTDVKLTHKVRELSKGMVTQLHLALVLAIRARLLVLDEPTLGLDLLVRRRFYDTLLNDYMDEERTILVTTHQVEEIEQLLTDVMFIEDGRIVLDTPVEAIGERYAQLIVKAGPAGRRARVQAFQ